MNHNIPRAILTLREPWDSCFTIEGEIEEIRFPDEFGLLFRGGNKIYLLVTRYVGEKIDGIWSGKELIVNIFDVSNEQNLSKRPIKIADLFIGSGSIEVKQ